MECKKAQECENADSEAYKLDEDGIRIPAEPSSDAEERLFRSALKYDMQLRKKCASLSENAEDGRKRVADARKSKKRKLEQSAELYAKRRKEMEKGKRKKE